MSSTLQSEFFEFGRITIKSYFMVKEKNGKKWGYIEMGFRSMVKIWWGVPDSSNSHYL